MKIIATLFTCALLITSSAHAFERDVYGSVRISVEEYYADSGEWSLVRIKTIEALDTDSTEFKIMSAKVSIQNANTGRGATETCLVTLIAENNEFFAINCF